jgi:hypothetical protein
MLITGEGELPVNKQGQNSFSESGWERVWGQLTRISGEPHVNTRPAKK